MKKATTVFAIVLSTLTVLHGASSPRVVVNKVFLNQSGFTQFTSIEVGSYYTEVTGINDRGQIVGNYQPSSNYDVQGFLLDRGTFTPIGFCVSDINNSGQIVGSSTPHFDQAVPNKGFLLDKGVLTIIEYPGSFHSFATGINNQGQIVGFYRETAWDFFAHGFLFDHGVYTSFDFPDGFSTFPSDINDKGEIVGHWWKVEQHLISQLRGFHGYNSGGFILENGVYIDYDVPGYEFGSLLSGVNSKGAVTGSLYSSAVDIAGFVDDGRTRTIVQFPSSTYTIPIGINDRGQVVGSYIVPGQSITRGFIAE